MYLVLGLLFIGCCTAGDFEGNAYQSQDRKTKTDQLWYAINEDATPLKFYNPLQIAEIFVEDAKTSFTNVADDMPTQYIGNFYERKKLIHTVGVIAICAFNITAKSNYTGIFRTGADSAFIRLSAAKEPLTENMTGALAPGIALKFMRDGMSSSNLVSMYSLVGQDSFNFFEHDFTNHVPSLNPDYAGLAEKALIAKFKTASSWPTMVGLSDMARFDQHGNEVTTPHFPYRLVFHPTEELHNKFPREYPGVPFYEQLSSELTPGTMYDVYAQDQPLQGNNKLFKIGEIRLTSLAITSQFGDRHMFHQHVFFEDDIAFKPQWEQPGRRDIEMQESAAEPGYEYGDLPY